MATRTTPPAYSPARPRTAPWASGEPGEIRLRESKTALSVGSRQHAPIDYAGRHGWQIAGEYVDTGWSGAKAKDEDETGDDDQDGEEDDAQD